jgi:hypothetical protein
MNNPAAPVHTFHKLRVGYHRLRVARPGMSKIVEGSRPFTRLRKLKDLGSMPSVKQRWINRNMANPFPFPCIGDVNPSIG